MINFCANCFNATQGYEVCPFCGYVEGTVNEPAFMLQPRMRLQNRYIIGTILGIGGFGVTYKAFDTRLASIVAIKEYFPQNLSSRMPGETEIKMFTGENSKAFMLHRQRFEQEGKNLAQFANEANIVNVLDNFNDNGTAYIVMEYLNGVTLKDYITQSGGALPQEKAVEILKGILTGLKSIHLKGIIHRDISPDNIYITQEGNVKLLDFGAARFAAKEEWTQSVVVKKGYAPPEQYRSNMKQSDKTDLYAAGATFYKMLTGQTPEESIERWEKDLLRRPSQIKEGIDTHIDKFTMKALALKSELRFSSAQNMIEALENDKGYDFPEEELKKRKTRSVLMSVIAVVLVFVVVGVVVLRPVYDEDGNLQTPEIIIQGETLADKNIKSDSIVFFMHEYDNRNGEMTALVNEFMQFYPEYSVEIVYENEVQEDYNDWDISSWYMQNMQEADLSLLFNGLSDDDYYHLPSNDDELTFADYAVVPISIWVASSVLTGDEPEYIDSLEGYFEFVNSKSLQTDAWDGIELLSIYAQEEIFNDDGKISDSWANNFSNWLKYDIANSITGNNNGYNAQSHAHWVFVSSEDLQESRNYAGSGTNLHFFPMLLDGELVISHTSQVYVNANSSENKQLVAMQLIHFMLSERGQTILNVINSHGIPLNKAVAEDFFTLNPEVAVLKPYLDDWAFPDYYVQYEDMQSLISAHDFYVNDYEANSFIDINATTEQNLATYENELNAIAEDYISYLNSSFN